MRSFFLSLKTGQSDIVDTAPDNTPSGSVPKSTRGRKSSTNRLDGLDPGELLSRAILSATAPAQDSPVASRPRWLTKRKLQLFAALALAILAMSPVLLSIAKRWNGKSEGDARTSQSKPHTQQPSGAQITRTTTPLVNLNSAPATNSGVAREADAAGLHKLEAAVALGDTAAQYQLGKKYGYGKGVPKDVAKAAGLYRMAAEKGCIEADVELGVLYSNGKVAFHPISWERVAAAWQIAAEKGDSSAQRRLGECYRNGRGVPHDPVKAVEWLQKSAEQGNSIAQWSLAKMYDGNRGLPRDDATAFKWMEKSALQGYEWAQYTLARMYATGTGVPKDPVKAYEWARKATENGTPAAHAILAQMYLKGEGVGKDVANAVTLSRKAADGGATDGLLLLNQIFPAGMKAHDTAQPDGFALMLKSAEEGNVPAQLGVGYMYLEGMGVAVNGKKGFEWILKSAENGNALAQALIGDMYESGIFVPRDEIKAAEWHAKSVHRKQSLPDVPSLEAGQPKFFDSN